MSSSASSLAEAFPLARSSGSSSRPNGQSQSQRGIPMMRVSDGSVNHDWPRRCSKSITEFPNEPYEVIVPIPVSIKQDALEDFTASFVRANIAMTGNTLNDAWTSLAAHILDVFEMLTEHPQEKLGRGPRQQLEILRQHIRER